MARRLAREEGIFLGYSAGSAIAALLQLKDQLTKEDVVVVVIHDHGSRYVGKIYNDEWMRERGFLEEELKVSDLINMKSDKTFFSIQKDATVKQTLNLMKEKDISQLPVMDNGSIVGSITESEVLSCLLENPMQNAEQSVKSIMGKAFPLVDENLAFSQLSNFISEKIPAIVAKDKAGAFHVLTKYDIIQAV